MTQLTTPVHVVYGVYVFFSRRRFFCFLVCVFWKRSVVDFSWRTQIDKNIPQNDTRALFFIADLRDGKGLRKVYEQWRFFFHGNDNYDIFSIGAILSFFPRIITRCSFLARGQPGRTKLKDSQAGHAPPSLPQKRRPPSPMCTRQPIYTQNVKKRHTRNTRLVSVSRRKRARGRLTHQPTCRCTSASTLYRFRWRCKPAPPSKGQNEKKKILREKSRNGKTTGENGSNWMEIRY